MRMSTGVNLPYSDKDYPPETWAQIERLRPQQFTLTSFAAEEVLDRLTRDYPSALFHVRPRTGPQHQPFPQDLLDFRSWPSERSLRECLGYLYARNVTPHLVMGNEPGLEWAPSWPTMDQHRQAASEYAEWFLREAEKIRQVYGGPISIAPMSQGWPDAEWEWFAILQEYGVFDVCDFLADHNYFADALFEEESWGNRAKPLLELLPRFSQVDNLETNDDGRLFAQDPQERASVFAGYVRWAAGTGRYRCVSLFTLRGAPDDQSKPAWWWLSDSAIDAVRAVMDELEAAEQQAAPVEPPAVIVLPELEPAPEQVLEPEPVSEQVPEPEPAPEPPIEEPTMPEPLLHFSPQQVADAIGCPIETAQRNYPRIAAALEERGINDRPVHIAALATVGVEVGSLFEPIHEYGTWQDWQNYGGGSRYAGRGFIQLTHDTNYRAAGDALGVDLVNDPDLALEPVVAARILAWFFETRGVNARDGSRWWSIPDLARASDWEWVRRVVNGGLNGWDRFSELVRTFEGISSSEPAPQPAAPPAAEPSIRRRPDLDYSGPPGGYGSRPGHFQIIDEGAAAWHDDTGQFAREYFRNCGPIAVAHLVNMVHWSQGVGETMNAGNAIWACAENGSYVPGDQTQSIPGLGEVVTARTDVGMVYRSTSPQVPGAALGWDEALELAKTRPILVNKPGHISVVVADNSGRPLLWLVQGHIGLRFDGEGGALTPANWSEWNWQTLYPDVALWGTSIAEEDDPMLVAELTARNALLEEMVVDKDRRLMAVVEGLAVVADDLAPQLATKGVDLAHRRALVDQIQQIRRERTG